MTVATASFSGSQAVDYFKTGTAAYCDYIWVQFVSPLSESEGLNRTLSGTWLSNVFDSGKASSVNFYWGPAPSGSADSGKPLGSVPDTGSTAALLGVGVFVLAAIKIGLRSIVNPEQTT